MPSDLKLPSCTCNLTAPQGQTLQLLVFDERNEASRDLVRAHSVHTIHEMEDDWSHGDVSQRRSDSSRDDESVEALLHTLQWGHFLVETWHGIET